MTDPRDHWHPMYLQIFGVRPWEIRDLTVDELNAMNKHIEQMTGRRG